MGLLANTIDGPERPTPLHLGPTKTLRDHVRSSSALSALKKSLVANLSAKRQLSVAKLSAKRIFSLAKRDFLVANGRMAADFSSPAYVMSFKSTRRSEKPVKKRPPSIQEELKKSYPTADTFPEKKRLTTWSLKTLHKHAIQKKTFTMNCRGQSNRHPICRGKLLSAHQGGAGRRCYGATCLT